MAEGMSAALPAAKYNAPPIKTAALTYKAMTTDRFSTFLTFCQNGGCGSYNTTSFDIIGEQGMAARQKPRLPLASKIW